MILDTRHEPGALYARLSGPFTLAEAQRTFLDILDSAAQLVATKVLVDGREVVGEPAAMERFYYGEFAAEATRATLSRGAVPSLRFAYVMNAPQLDPRRFGETVAVNRGMDVKAFDNLEDARGWLDLT